jgi:flagellar hook-associated protein 1 FlgK
MRATFYAFEAAKSGLTAAQAGLDVTANNIANQSSEGYSRQIVDQSATHPKIDRYKLAQHSVLSYDMGVDVKGIRQMRDQFLDLRFRSANAQNGAVSKTLTILSDMENSLDETQTDGLNVMLQDLYSQLQTLSQNAGEVEFSSLVRSSAQKVTQSINHYAVQLENISAQEMDSIGIGVKDVNTLLGKIDTINHSIQAAKLQNNSINELNDTRNVYLDQLSAYMDITVTDHDDGTLSIKAGGASLLDATSNTVAAVSVTGGAGNVSIMADANTLALTSGSLAGSIQVLNGYGSYAVTGQSDFRGIPYYLDSLNSLADSFGSTFNAINGTGKPLFTGNTAATIAISSQWLADPNYITATANADQEAGRNDNILKFIDAMDEGQDVSANFHGTFEDFTLSMMTDIAIDISYNNDIAETSDKVLASITNQRQSVMGVDINEETANLMKYQRAFEASSRVITAMDEALDVLINRTGMVGR